MAELESFSSRGTLPNKVQPKYVYIATSPENKTFRCPVISRPKTSAPMNHRLIQGFKITPEAFIEIS
ncbi:hypothetical protein CEXT_202781 [Caerostris extrusa]|uniref:Uncharacterized protein n=1 Tax=Caerostris extrusa TaxID=172846 RepID=A0AAV4TKJ2_CAEEX|nr:hypothetical protein CEXT_202781 [Caerostris extrusa]